jgi:DNA-binding transcriptional regulator YiaG
MHDWEADPRPVPDILPEWEASHGWSSAEAARRVGAPYLTYRQWRDGRHKPPAMLRRLMVLTDRLENP